MFKQINQINTKSDNNSWNELSNSKICVDLHCHTNYSDGTISPEQIAKSLSEAGVKYACITDHNTLDGLALFNRALSKYGIGYISGIEITTEHKHHTLHLLAYGFNPADSELNTMLHKNKINNGLPDHTIPQSFLTAHKIIDLIHDAGGIVSLAHPLKTIPDIYKLKAVISDLKRYGLDAIEAIYGPDSPENEIKLLEIASKSNLIITAGTDFHSPKESTLGVTITKIQWKIFRDALLKTSSDAIHETDNRLANIPKKQKNKWFSIILNIFLPAFFSLALFIISLFVFLFPYFEDTLMDRKRENIRQLTQVAWGVLNEASQEVNSGNLTLEQAQMQAKKRIETMRYGIDDKDYFWLQDTSPKIIMHPYRTDLNNQDVTDFVDPQGTRIFVAFSELVLSQEEGYLSYVWQWKDDTERLEPKESYVRLFEPWGWIIGTGIYINDVQAEIANLRSYIVKISIGVISIVLLLLLYIIRQGVLLERSRSEAEELLFQSVERYKALSEASTEGALFLYNGQCRYANTVMYELLGCANDRLELMSLNDIFPDIKANNDWREYLFVNKQINTSTIINGVVKRCDGTLISCNMRVKSGMNNPRAGLMILVRRTIDLAEHTGGHVALNRLLHIPSSIASNLADSIKNAYRVEDVAILCKETSGLVVSLLESGTSSIAIAYMISTISDLVTQKIIELTIAQMGTPPAQFAFFALGSHARQAQTLFSDQDNAIIYETTGEEDEEIVQDYFLNLGIKVCDGLELAGYQKCKGLKMASNPEWCKPLPVWKSYFEEWVHTSQPQQVVEFCILHDFRTIFGDPEIATKLRDFIYNRIKETPFFLSQVAQNALLFKTPMRLFRNIVTTGSKGHSGRIDVKTPAMAIVTFARLYSLKHEIRETNTLLQLDAIKSLGIILDSKHRDIVTTFEMLIKLRLWSQVHAFEHNEELDNWIDPDDLGHLEEVLLRECFIEIDELQNLIQHDFLA